MSILGRKKCREMGESWRTVLHYKISTELSKTAKNTKKTENKEKKNLK